MSKICVLGGCGVVGSVAVRTLTSFDDFSEIIIGDIDINKANKLISEIKSDKLSAIKVDALDPTNIKQTIKGCDVVLNTTGPFYKFVPTILKAVIELGINYVDVCDDVDVTIDILNMDTNAKNANVSALIGMGSSPGVTNIFAKYVADQLLNEIESIDIYHAHGGEPTEGAGVVAHRIHAMTIDIPMFLDGELKTVRFFDETGIKLREEVDFYLLGPYKVYPYPHPEQITIPRYINGLKRVTNKGTVLPDAYFNLIMKMVKLGITSEDPIRVNNQTIKPLDFTISYVIEQREKILKEVNFGNQRGALKVVIKGKKNGNPHQYNFSISSTGEAMGEGTGIPAAMGAVLMNRGRIQQKGVFPPEGGVNPLEFIGLMAKILRTQKIGGTDPEGPLLFESIDADGKVKKLQIF